MVTLTLAWSHAHTESDPTTRLDVARLDMTAVGNVPSETTLNVAVKNLAFQFDPDAQPPVGLLPARGLSSRVLIR